MPTTSGAVVLPYPAQDGSSPDNVPVDIKVLADAIAAQVPGYLSGSRAANQPGTARRLLLDGGVLYVDDGTAWVPAVPSPDLSGYATTSALGSGLSGRVSTTGGSTIIAGSPGVLPLTIRTAAGQTAPATAWQAFSGEIRVAVDPLLRLVVMPGGDARFGSPTDSGIHVEPRTTAGRGLTVRGLPGQSGVPFQVEDSGGISRLKVQSTGVVEVNSDLYALGRVFFGGGDYFGATVNVNTRSGERGAVVRLAAGQTANALEVQDSGGTVRTLQNADGGLEVGRGAVGSYASSIGGPALPGRALTVYAGGASVTPLTVRMAAGQTASPVDVQNSAGTSIVRYSADGSIGAVGVVQAGVLIETLFLGGTLSSRSRTATEPAAIFRLLADQTDVMQAQSANGAVAFAVRPTGPAYAAFGFEIAHGPTPAVSGLNAGRLYVNGAGQLRFLAKNGTDNYISG